MLLPWISITICFSASVAWVHLESVDMLPLSSTTSVTICGDSEFAFFVVGRVAMCCPFSNQSCISEGLLDDVSSPEVEKKRECEGAERQQNRQAGSETASFAGSC